MIPVYKPYLPRHALRHAHDAIDSGWISWQGKYRDAASNKLRSILGCKYVLLTSSGTSAMHLVAKSLIRHSPHLRKIIVPNNIYVAAWNAFLYDGNLELILSDMDLNTWNMMVPENIDSNTAVLAVHNIGNVMDVPQIISSRNCMVVEDSCEAFMGKYGDKMAGTSGLCSALSFFSNKNVTSGEGGAFITNDEEIFTYASKVHGQGQTSTRYIHDVIGYNYRMTNVQAAILLGQLEIIKEIEERKNNVFKIYKKRFKNMPTILPQRTSPHTSHSKWMYGIRIVGSPGYEFCSKFLRNNGVDSRPMFYPVSRHPYLNNTMKALSDEYNAMTLSKECIILPSYPSLGKDINTVVSAVMRLEKEIRKGN